MDATQLAARWGIQTRYENYNKEVKTVPQRTVRALLDVMDANEVGPPPAGAQVTTLAGGADLTNVVALRTEDGGEEAVAGELPDDLPLGYHRLVRDDGSEQSLIVTPSACYLPPHLRVWGWAVQLYSVLSETSWGIGDLHDLRRFCGWASERGAGAIMLNPLHAPLPIPAQQPSPYFPSSRCFRNPLYLALQDLEGAAGSALVDELAAVGRSLNGETTIDRDRVYELKMRALEELWQSGSRDTFEAWAEEQGDALTNYATYASLAEAHGGGPGYGWDEPLARGEAEAVKAWQAEHADRIAFHAWIQWLLDRQLRDASAAVGIVNDLAIGVDPDGADAWLWRESFVRGVTVGAPPDEFNLAGQNWGLPPLDPWKLRAGGYEPFIQTIRSAMRHSAGIRIDHVMGLFRLFWIPDGADAAAGAYVRYPHEDLLSIVALESHRAQAYVVGEDLGTVEDLVRDEMEQRKILSYRLLWFEEDLPEEYPELSLAAVTNHDLQTVAGLWSRSDIEAQRKVGLEVNVEGTEAQREQLRKWLDLDDEAPVADVVAGAYGLLGRAASAVVLATLEDALEVEERPNMPGTTNERPNWSLPLPLPLEAIERDERVGRVADLLAQGRKQSK
ncbi:MAG: 4-alpha-glucanotransferase [Actinomycetota bacterium]|nr:4-alpha-glucanotransferase [Actinomycetota bacterium]